MGLPGDALFGPRQWNRAGAEQEIDAEPHNHERKNAWVTQGDRERCRLHLIVRLVAPAHRPKRAATLKHEAYRGGHCPGDRRRGADHWRPLAKMSREMDGGAGRRGRREEDGKPRRPEPARNRGAEGQEPYGIDTQMSEIAVDKGISHERPHRGAPSPRP